MEVTWSKPPTNVINGKLLGYRVYYYSTKNPDRVFNRTVTKPDERNVTLTGLHKFTSYRVRVVAFTRVGEGVASLPKGGTTLEDSKCDRNVLWAFVQQVLFNNYIISIRSLSRDRDGKRSNCFSLRHLLVVQSVVEILFTDTSKRDTRLRTPLLTIANC